MVDLVGAGHPAAGAGHPDGRVGDAHRRPREVGADVTLRDVGMGIEVGVLPQPDLAAGQRLVEGEGVDLPVAGDEGQAHLAVDVEGDALQHLVGFDVEELGHALDARQVGCVLRRHRGHVGGVLGAEDGHRGLPHRRLHVGGVVAALAPHEVVLPHRSDGHELVVDVAADLAGLGLDGSEGQPAPLEDAVVGVVHQLVARLQSLDVGVEGVGVLHEELPAAQEAETGPQLVAVLPVDLVEVDRQVAVAAVLARHRDRDDLLGRRRQGEARLLAVGETEHERPVGLVPARPLPQLERLDDRQQELLGAGGVHLLPDDLLDPAQDPVAQRQPGVDPGRHLADVAGPDQQPVAVDLGVGRVVPERPQEQL